MLSFRRNGDTEQILLLNDDEGLKSSHYDGTKPTVFSVHGWLSSSAAPWLHQQKKLHLEIVWILVWFCEGLLRRIISYAVEDIII